MADILIRKVSEETKELLRRRAERRGVSLEADLREALDQLARESATPEDTAPFGSWLRDIARPGSDDLDAALGQLRSKPVRPADLS